MKFKDVAHLYIGCMVQWKNPMFKSGYNMADFTLADANWQMIQKCKPLLYPLSAMTEEHIRKLGWMEGYFYYDKEDEFSPKQFKFLLDNHFDLFNLIEQGEAIDVTTLETNPYKEK